MNRRCVYLRPISGSGYKKHKHRGETPCTPCLEAAADYKAHAKAGTLPARLPSWPAEPLLPVLAARGITPKHLGSTARQAIKRGRLTDRLADQVAIDLGLMPWDIWPDWLAAANPTEVMA